jgi:hypothetical protein
MHGGSKLVIYGILFQKPCGVGTLEMNYVSIVSPVWFRHVQSVSLRPWAWITVKSTGGFHPKGNDSFIS